MFVCDPPPPPVSHDFTKLSPFFAPHTSTPSCVTKILGSFWRECVAPNCHACRGSDNRNCARAVALVLPLPDPQVPEQHEPCCILCKKKKAPEWKASPAMHQLRCRLHHYYKPTADCILLNRREWRVEEKLNWFFVDRQQSCWRSQRRTVPPENFQFPCIIDSLRCRKLPCELSASTPPNAFNNDSNPTPE